MKTHARLIGKFAFLIFLLVALTVMSSCGKQYSKSKIVAAGFTLEVTSSKSTAAKIVSDEFIRLDKIFNLKDPKSELSLLNGAQRGVAVTVSPELLEALLLGQQVNTMTNGSFDYSQGALYDFWKEQGKQNLSDFPDRAQISVLMNQGGMANIVINKEARTVMIKKEGLKIDLGGIVKGYMIDKAVLRLKAAGIKDALINTQGATYCLGARGKRLWRVGVTEPKEMQGVIETENLIDEAVVTQGAYERIATIAGKMYSNFINPKTGLPIDSNVYSVTVVTLNATTADSLATAFCVMGLEGTRAFLQSVPSTMRVFVVTNDGKDKRVHILR
jgi:thiamine biosynthesis lipoprotein